MDNLEATCFFSTPEYTRTFRGRLLKTMKGRGTLTLNDDGLSLSGIDPQTLRIPLRSIRKIALGRFSWWTHLGLRYIEVEHSAADSTATILLTPTYFTTLPVWHTNGVVRRWYEQLKDRLSPEQAGPE
jgi:hypothetical protein